MRSSLDLIRESQGKLTPRYTRVSLKADTLVASAVQESAGGATQQQLPTAILDWVVSAPAFTLMPACLQSRENVFCVWETLLVYYIYKTDYLFSKIRWLSQPLF